MSLLSFKYFWTLLLLLLLSLTLSLNMAAQENTETDSFRIYTKKAFHYYSVDSFTLAYDAVFKAFDTGDSLANKKAYAQLFGLKGYIYLNRGANLQAIESFSISKNIGVEIDNIEIQIAGYHGLGRVYISIKDYNNASYNLQQGINLANKHKKIRPEAILNNALGILESSRQNYDSALIHFKEFMIISKSLKDTLSIIYANINIGEMYIKINKPDTAITYLKVGELLNKSINNSQASASILANYGAIEHLNGNYHEAIKFVNQSLKISFNNDFSEFITDNYYSLIDNYEKLQDMNNAIDTYNKLDKYKDSLNSINYEKKHEALISQMEIEEKMAKVAFWEHKYRNRTIILILSISLSIVVIILLVILFKSNQLNKLKFRKETKSLSNTIDEKNRELVTNIIQESQHNDIVELINIHIEKISKSTSIEEAKNDLFALQREITTKEQITNNWESFKIQFLNVHPEFFNSMKRIEPKLTQSDLRMCAYIKMNMTTKEIANILNISDRSIQTNRYRLKKKLQLKPNTDLIAYIQGV